MVLSVSILVINNWKVAHPVKVWFSFRGISLAASFVLDLDPRDALCQMPHVLKKQLMVVACTIKKQMNERCAYSLLGVVNSLGLCTSLTSLVWA